LAVVKVGGAVWRLMAFVAPWIPFFLLWVLAARIQGGVSNRMALTYATLSIGTAALLSIPVRMLCAALPWPAGFKALFLAKHALGALLFAAAWAGTLYVHESLVQQKGLLALIATSRVLGWQIVMGLWLYGLVAGLTYAAEMHRRAEAHQRRAAEAEAQAAAARLEAIRARLHPHFLFNALHSVGVLVRSDPPAAEAAVESLGELLRLALRRDARSLVPMDEEWSFTRRYLDFERIRYGERLSVVASVAPDSLDCLVPPFAVQTLVENAVQHAVCATAGGRIEIRVSVAGPTLVVEVEDEGAPARAESPSEGNHYGLAALRERMAGLYGPAARLETGHATGGGFLVRMVTPAVVTDEAEAAAAAAQAPA
jgi:signal transduction histidine kinase